MQTLNTLKVAVALTLFAHAAAANNGADFIGELKQCARTVDKSERFACYETLGNKALEEEQLSTAEPAQPTLETDVEADATAVTETKQSLPDSYGKSAAVTKAKPEVHRGHVTSCQRAHDKRWFFLFDNGQVWKQVDRKRSNFKDCDFKVSISKDGFGFVMHIDDKKGKIRVRRHR